MLLPSSYGGVVATVLARRRTSLASKQALVRCCLVKRDERGVRLWRDQWTRERKWPEAAQGSCNKLWYRCMTNWAATGGGGWAATGGNWAATGGGGAAVCCLCNLRLVGRSLPPSYVGTIHRRHWTCDQGHRGHILVDFLLFPSFWFFSVSFHVSMMAFWIDEYGSSHGSKRDLPHGLCLFWGYRAPEPYPSTTLEPWFSWYFFCRNKVFKKWPWKKGRDFQKDLYNSFIRIK